MRDIQILARVCAEGRGVGGRMRASTGRPYLPIGRVQRDAETGVCRRGQRTLGRRPERQAREVGEVTMFVGHIVMVEAYNPHHHHS
jgi:hypothetical protein